MGKKLMKEVVVSKKFLLNLANSIYNPKTKKFLRMCDGSLQEEDGSTIMHCGLGELYLSMTGHHPMEDGVCEEDVVEYAVNHSTLVLERDADKAKVVAALVKLDLSKELKNALIESVGVVIEDDNDTEDRIDDFRNLLDGIPRENDETSLEPDTAKTYRARAKAVAAQIRRAAELLPY